MIRGGMSRPRASVHFWGGESLSRLRWSPPHPGERRDEARALRKPKIKVALRSPSVPSALCVVPKAAATRGRPFTTAALPDRSASPIICSTRGWAPVLSVRSPLPLVAEPARPARESHGRSAARPRPPAFRVIMEGSLLSSGNASARACQAPEQYIQTRARQTALAPRSGRASRAPGALQTCLPLCGLDMRATAHDGREAPGATSLSRGPW